MDQHFECIRRSFAMMALAMVSATFTREQLETDLPPGMTAELVPPSIADKLKERMISGAVTTIRPNPEPFTPFTTKVRLAVCDASGACG